MRRLLGTARAFEWLTTGRRLGADEARDLGRRQRGRARRRADAPGATRWRASTRRCRRGQCGSTKRLLDEAETASFDEQLEREAVTQAELTQTHDFREGVAAFLAKRDPAFTGADVERPHPITVVNDDNRRSLAIDGDCSATCSRIPHVYLADLWTLLALLVAIVNWFIALVRGQTPRPLRAWFERYLRYVVHVDAYTYLLADPFPKFRGWAGTYPVDLRIDPPAPQRRWTDPAPPGARRARADLRLRARDHGHLGRRSPRLVRRRWRPGASPPGSSVSAPTACASRCRRSAISCSSPTATRRSRTSSSRRLRRPVRQRLLAEREACRLGRTRAPCPEAGPPRTAPRRRYRCCA